MSEVPLKVRTLSVASCGLTVNSQAAMPVWYDIVNFAGCRNSRRCTRDTYPESYITKHTSVRGGGAGLPIW